MCGIIAIVGREPVTKRLVEGLKRLEYRGYDSAGIAVVEPGGALARRRAEGKIANLETALGNSPVEGAVGIAHTRWATHGAPSETNAHPHIAGQVAVVHNGIIENYRELREELAVGGAVFATETDSEVIAHLINRDLSASACPRAAVQAAIAKLEGAFSIAVAFSGAQDVLIGARLGPPLAAGARDGESFLGSDALALASLTDHVVFLEDGELVEATREGIQVFNAEGSLINRAPRYVGGAGALAEKGAHRHFMEKEIHDQPEAIGHTLSAYLDAAEGRTRSVEGLDFAAIERLSIVACGTAYYAGLVSKYWFEPLAGLPVDIDVASEFRYRRPALTQHTLGLAISQSGETADTRAAIELCKQAGLGTAGLVNVPTSTIARLADLALPTHAGVEIGVASTKAFTAQLSALAALAVRAARERGRIDAAEEQRLVEAALETPRLIAEAIDAEAQIIPIAREIAKARDVLYLGRGVFYPLALEAALKLKEISYIHAEGYAAGELKHGPIALIDEATPVVTVAPSDELFDKTTSSIAEVAARGGRVTLITDAAGADRIDRAIVANVIEIPQADPFVQPIIAAAPVQLLAYHVALEKGTDVDQPRNLAKSVTVE